MVSIRLVPLEAVTDAMAQVPKPFFALPTGGEEGES